MRPSPIACSLLILVAACGDDGGVSPDAATDATFPPDGPAGCPRTAAPADRARHLVVSRPYDAGGGQAPTFEVLDLSATGTLTRPNRMFELGRTTSGTIEFTPDGEIGLVALQDGKLGVFRLDASGVPTVVHAGFAGSFYATRVVVDPRGDRAWILEGNTRANGGGIYLVTIGCDGTLTDQGLVTPAGLPAGLAFTGDHAVLVARDVGDGSPVGDDVHLIRLDASASRIGGADAFGDDDAIVSGSALTHDGAAFLIADNSIATTNRVAVVGVTASGLTPRAVLSPISDPQGIAASPFGDVAVVSSFEGDAIFVLDTGGASGAWQVRGEVPYVGGDPLLPGDLTSIARGMLRGHVFVAENVSVRHLAFRDTGAVEDLGSLAFGEGLQNITGALGVTP